MEWNVVKRHKTSLLRSIKCTDITHESHSYPPPPLHLQPKQHPANNHHLLIAAMSTKRMLWPVHRSCRRSSWSGQSAHQGTSTAAWWSQCQTLRPPAPENEQKQLLYIFCMPVLASLHQFHYTNARLLFCLSVKSAVYRETKMVNMKTKKRGGDADTAETAKWYGKRACTHILTIY